ncbi:MAG: copper homeostasis protein CutC [Planctomycetota bacterium]
MHATTPNEVFDASRAANSAGADTIELCAGMELGGLTPSAECIEAAREGFAGRAGLMVMIRPHADSFVYSPDDHKMKLVQIEAAHRAGADGVVFGPLLPDDQMHHKHVTQLVEAAQSFGLKTTFHRAFDLIADPLAALGFLIDLGVDRVLTSGIRWGYPGTALDGVDRIASYARYAGRRMQIVVGGGVTPQNAPRIIERLPLNVCDIALHAYSGAQKNGRVTVESVRTLIESVNGE